MPVLAEDVLAPVQPHATVFVHGGGGGIQTVPWNLPADGNVRFGLGDGGVFGGLGALTEDEKQKLAERIRAAMSTADVQAILEIIPTVTERQEVAERAVAIGADASRVQEALDSLESKASYKQWFKPPPMPVRIVWGVLSTASFAACVYHGYKRKNRVSTAIWWGFMGALFPVIAPTIAFAQGFGKPKKGFKSGLARRRRRRS